MIVYIYNIGVDLYNGFNGLRHRINWTYFAVLDGLAHPLYSVYTVLCELNDTCHFEPNKSQTFSTTININTKLTTYNIPKIRLLEMMKSYSYNKKY
ncbi:hypothetical protein, partial [uncultured Holdemanella sp.]|uniref:hypothetical protein n=1 Tax=uncultured Holdemanella sp. TaxID=1763549 RepID=UPI0025D740DD